MTEVGMPQAEPGPDAAEKAAERVAALILQATQQAARDILDASTKAARDIAEAATKIPTALSTPASNGIDAEELALIFERHNLTNPMVNPDPFNDGIGYDPDIDIIVDSTGTRWNPNPGNEPVIPSPTRETYATVPPGTPIVPQLPRLDK